MLGWMAFTRGGLSSANTSVALRVGTGESEYILVEPLTAPVAENIVASWTWPLIPPTGIDMVGTRLGYTRLLVRWGI